MNIINKKCAWAICVLLALGIITGLFITRFIHAGQQVIECSSPLRLSSAAEDFEGDMNLFLFMDDRHSGYLSISGSAHHQRHKYQIERSYRFRYEKTHGDTYHLSDISVSTRAADNIDNQLMSRVFFSEDRQHGRYIKIKPVDNALLIEMLHSPVLICVPR